MYIYMIYIYICMYNFMCMYVYYHNCHNLDLFWLWRVYLYFLFHGASPATSKYKGRSVPVLMSRKCSLPTELGGWRGNPMAAWNMCNTTMLRCHEKVHVTLWHFLKPGSGERVNKELSSGHDFLDDSCQCYRWQCYQYLTAHSVWLVVWRNLIVISHHCTWIFVRFILMTKKNITKNHKTKTFPNISRHVEPSSTKKR